MDQRQDNTGFLDLMQSAVRQREFANLARCDEAHDDHIKNAHRFERYAEQVAGRKAVAAYIGQHAPQPEYLKARFPEMF